MWLTYKWGAKPFHTAVGRYDEMGRITNYYNLFGNGQGGWHPSYDVGRSYNLAGQVTSQTYPSGRTVSYGYDSAGRMNSFSGNLGDSASRTYATGITYSPFGGMRTEQFGTDTAIYHKLQYNIRGQLWDVRLSTVNDDLNWNRGAIVNHYVLQLFGGGTSGPDNNGNLLVQQHWVPNDDAITGYSLMQQNYDYDALNRLTGIGEYTNGATLSGSQNFGYDRWGNRTITSATGAGINNKQFTVNTTNNRLGVPSGQSGTMTYDAAGNLTTDTYSGSGVTRVYDADNRMVSETQTAGFVAGAYTYNADGQRVRRKVGATETWQVYGIDGELLAEYAEAGAVTSPQKEYGYRNGQLLITAEPNAGNNVVQWLVADQLGTPRMLADKTGSLAGIKRHDYLPFGEELLAGTGNRSLASGYSADNVRQKFTSKERDIETGLDYFEARYYSSVQGRFTTVDPENVGAGLFHPQSWNGYSYSLNNPLRFIDPDGLRWAQVTHAGGTTYDWFDDDEEDDNGQTAYDRALGGGWSAVTFDESKPFSYTNGHFAPGATLDTTTLSPDGRVNTSYHKVTWGEWVEVLAIFAMADKSSPYLGVKATGGFDKLVNEFVNNMVKVDSNIAVILPTVPSPAIGPTKGPPHPRDTARKRGNELVEKFKSAGEGIGRSGGGGEKYRKAGAELIREANRVGNTVLREAMKKEGKRLINYGKGVSHK